MLHWAVVTVTAAGFLLILQHVNSCNEAVCGSIVSKCLLTQSCKCDLKNCTCCRECFNCLSGSYIECCSCVDMCPSSNDTGLKLSKQSYIEDLPEKVPGLFKELTIYPDAADRWISFTYPIELDITQFAPKKDIKLQLQSSEQESAPIKPHTSMFNCTVAFMTQCMSWSKCKRSCQSMGASSLRWFHNGCCQCVGDTCINYGMNEPRCLECSLSDLEDETEDESNMVYDDQNWDDPNLDDVDIDTSDDINI